jgi:hypothetical protein
MKNICEQKGKDDLLGWHSIVGAIDPKNASLNLSISDLIIDVR